jgi:hypothetical protein
MSFPLDMPDDYPWWPGGQRSILTDLAELAARLGSPAVYDRRGQVVWMDDGRYGLAPWISIATGTGASVKVTSEETQASGFSIELTAASNGAHSVTLYRYFNVSERNKIGIALGIAFLTDFELFQLTLDAYYPASRYSASLQVDPINEKLLVMDETGDFVEVATLTNVIAATARYEEFKLVADFEAGRYVRLLHNETEYDLSTILMYTGAGVTDHRQYLEVYLKGLLGDNGQAKLGRVIITAGEP